MARFHLDDLFAYSELKEHFSRPLIVVYNPGAKSEQAIYEITTGGHKYLQVNVQYKKLLGNNLIVTYYGIDEVPKGQVLWTPEKK